MKESVAKKGSFFCNTFVFPSSWAPFTVILNALYCHPERPLLSSWAPFIVILSALYCHPEHPLPSSWAGAKDLLDSSSLLLLRMTGKETFLRMTGKETFLRMTGKETLLRMTGKETFLRKTGKETFLRMTGKETFLRMTGKETLLRMTEKETFLRVFRPRIRCLPPILKTAKAAWFSFHFEAWQLKFSYAHKKPLYCEATKGHKHKTAKAKRLEDLATTYSPAP